MFTSFSERFYSFAITNQDTDQCQKYTVTAQSQLAFLQEILGTAIIQYELNLSQTNEEQQSVILLEILAFRWVPIAAFANSGVHITSKVPTSLPSS